MLEQDNPMLAALVKANAPAAPADTKSRTVTLPVLEQGVLKGLFAARAVVEQQINGAISEGLCAREGIHFSRVSNYDVQTGVATIQEA